MSRALSPPVVVSTSAVQFSASLQFSYLISQIARLNGNCQGSLT